MLIERGIAPEVAALLGMSEVPAFNLTLTYEDVAGNRWATTGHWIRQPGVYVDLAIAER
jgi:hypothetical protein